MKFRITTWLAWSLCVISVALVGSGLYFLIRNLPGQDVFSPFFLNNGVAGLAFSTVGALISSRRPGNPVGWLFAVSGLLFAVEAFAGEYGTYAVFFSPSLPGGLFTLWFSSWNWISGGICVLFVFLLFPEGRLPSPRWRVVAALLVLSILLQASLLAFSPGPMDPSISPSLENPFAVHNAALLKVIEVLLIPLSVISVLAPLGALAVRFRRGSLRERQQIKWVIYAVSVLVAAIVIVSAWPNLDGTIAAGALFLIGFLGIPGAIGVAMLRYRLYDIDVIINRTLVYAALSTMLALVYVGLVVSLQYAFRTLTGGSSQLAIVASTLTIAALFSPLRRRIQSFVDRRFYRNKYDAARVLEGFSIRLRNETDLNQLGNETVAVVRETVQPEFVSLWLRSLHEGAWSGHKRGTEE